MMNYEVYVLMKLFGERYIYCDTQQAIDDAKNDRAEMIAAYNAILRLAAPDGITV